MHLVAGLESTTIERDGRPAFEHGRLRRGHVHTLTLDGAGAAGRFLPHHEVYTRHAVIITGIHQDRHLTGGADGGIGGRRHDLHAWRLIGDDGERQRVGQLRREHGSIGARRRLGAPSPRAVTIDRDDGFRWHTVARCRRRQQGDLGSPIAQHGVTRPAAQHDAHLDARPARDPQRRHRLQGFVGAAEVGRIHRAQRDVAQPAAFLDHECGVEFGGAAVVHAQLRGRPHGAQGQRHAAIDGHAEYRIAPCLAFGATRDGDRMAPSRHHLHGHRHATRHARGELVERQRRQECAAPGTHRLQYRRQTIWCDTRRDDERPRAYSGPHGGKAKRASEAGGERRRECTRRKATRHIVGGTSTKEAGGAHFERPAQRPFTKLLFLFHHAGDAGRRELLLQATVPQAERERRPRHGHDGEEQRQGRRQIDPTTATQYEGGNGDKRGDDARRHERRRDSAAGGQRLPLLIESRLEGATGGGRVGGGG